MLKELKVKDSKGILGPLPLIYHEYNFIEKVLRNTLCLFKKINKGYL